MATSTRISSRPAVSASSSRRAGRLVIRTPRRRRACAKSRRSPSTTCCSRRDTRSRIRRTSASSTPLLTRHRAQHSARLRGDGHRDGIGDGDRDGARGRHRRASQEHVDRSPGGRSRPGEAIGERHDPQADHAAAPKRYGARSERAHACASSISGVPIVDRRRTSSSASSPIAICSSSASSTVRCSDAMTKEQSHHGARRHDARRSRAHPRRSIASRSCRWSMRDGRARAA